MPNHPFIFNVHTLFRKGTDTGSKLSSVASMVKTGCIDLIHARSFQVYVINFQMAYCKRREGHTVLQPDHCVRWQRVNSTVRIPMTQK